MEQEFTIGIELGLHARPAGRFVSMAGRFDAEIELGRGGEWVSGRSVLSILSLAAAKGTRVRIRAVGHDAERAVESLGRLLEQPGEPNVDPTGSGSGPPCEASGSEGR